MGGDHAPTEVVKGAVAAAREFQIQVTLVGLEAVVKPELARLGGAPGVTIHHAPEVIDPHEAPVAAVRQKKESSIVLGLRRVKEGEADGFLSAGSTGALLAGGIFVLGRLSGIDRPAYGAVLPALSGRGTLLLDVGLSVDNRPEHLVQFAVMGRVYAQQVMGVAEPRVALLNNGTEAGKGNAVTKAAHALLSQAEGLGFIGHVEGRDLPLGTADVVVADGFVGNVALKVFEGAGLGLMGMMKEALSTSLSAKLGGLLVRPALRRLLRRFDYAETGGAPILGLAAPVVKCHGASDARAIKNGIRVLRDLIAGQALARMTEGMARVQHLLPRRTRKGDEAADA